MGGWGVAKRTKSVKRDNSYLSTVPYRKSEHFSKTFMNDSKIRVRFKESCLKQEKVTFIPGSLINLFIVNELDARSRD